MPQFTIKTREKYAHITTYEVEAPTAEEAIRLVKENKVEDYTHTEIDGYDPADEFLGLIEVCDEDGNEVEAEVEDRSALPLCTGQEGGNEA